MLKKSLMLILTAAFIVALTGCNTLHGAGQDIEAVGEGLQDMTDN
jgi:predicted small secreted protein